MFSIYCNKYVYNNKSVVHPYHFDMDPDLDPDPGLKSKEILTVFFNQIYDTQNYKFFCYKLAYYSYILTKKVSYF